MLITMTMVAVDIGQVEVVRHSTAVIVVVVMLYMVSLLHYCDVRCFKISSLEFALADTQYSSE